MANFRGYVLPHPVEFTLALRRGQRIARLDIMYINVMVMQNRPVFKLAYG